MSEFERIVSDVAVSDADTLISGGISHAMSYREHPAAYRIPGGVGMLAAFRDGSAGGVFVEGLIAVVITDDNEVITENHKSRGFTPDQLDENVCWGYRLTGDAGLTISDGFVSKSHDNDDYRDAYEFWRDTRYASGARYLGGGGLMPSEERDIALRLSLELGHTFTDPRISHLVAVALGEIG